MEASPSSVTWFTEFQLHAVIRNGVVPEWFHGLISRKSAEELLQSRPPGYFLIRVSESRFGYTLSYRDKERCRHFMVDALKDSRYVIVGEKTYHHSLQDLVDFHRRSPILPFNQLLTVPCGQLSQDKTDYAELLFTRRQETDPTPPEDMPPALPYRAPPTPLRSSNQLYPCLSEEYQGITAEYTWPVLSARRSYSTSSAQPDVPRHTSSAPLRQNWTFSGTQEEEAPHPAIASLVTLKKMLGRKPSAGEEHTYAEIGEGCAENEYLPGKQSKSAPEWELPHEYTPPPPFAPGF